MPVKIRLARHGRKRRPFYYIVAADSRAPRDGRFIERIGSYDPNTNPASIDLNFDKALEWLRNGAVPTDTCRAILSHEGVLYKNHLLKGVAKEAFSEQEAESKFETWKADKRAKVQAKKDGLKTDAKKALEAKLEKESEVNKARAEEIAKKRAVVVEEEKAEEEANAEAEAEVVAEDATVEVAETENKEEKTEE